MKKALFLTIFTLITSITFAQTDMKYEMVSYSGGANNPQDRAETRFLNLGMFNQQYFTINYTNFSNSIQGVFDLVIGISIATAIILFMIAAFQKIIQGKDVGSVKAGDEGMKNAIIGLMIILSTWLIINTINPDLLRLPMLSGLDGLKAAQQQQTQSNITAEPGA